MNQSDQMIEFIFSENNNYHQIGNAFLEFDIKVRKNDTTNFHTEDPIRILSNAFAFVLKKLVCLQQSVQILKIINYVVKYLLL